MKRKRQRKIGGFELKIKYEDEKILHAKCNKLEDIEDSLEKFKRKFK